MSQGSRLYPVTPPESREIGAALDALGDGFGHDVITWEAMENGRALEGCEVLFGGPKTNSRGWNPRTLDAPPASAPQGRQSTGVHAQHRARG
jgi:hypothetical protein